jgi:hypothetical protein
MAQWEKASQLVKTPAERAEVEYVRGWGFRVLTRYGKELESASKIRGDQEKNEPGVRVEGLPTRKQILAAFTAATELAPDNATYWQSLGDAIAGDAFLPGVDRSRAMDAYRRSLTLQERNAGLCYRLYQMEMEAQSKDKTNGDTGEAQGYLRRAAESDGPNAYPRYQLAALQFRETRYSLVHSALSPDVKDAAVAAVQNEKSRRAARQAITAIEQGNAAPRYSPPRYQPAVPKLLAAVWDYTGVWENIGSFLDGGRLRELARAACGYAEIALKENDPREAVRAARAAIGMSYQLIGDWPIRDATRGGGEALTSLVGSATAGIGYSALLKVYQQTGDEDNAERVAAEYDAFKQRVKARSKAVQGRFSRGSLYEDY